MTFQAKVRFLPERSNYQTLVTIYWKSVSNSVIGWINDPIMLPCNAKRRRQLWRMCSYQVGVLKERCIGRYAPGPPKHLTLKLPLWSAIRTHPISSRAQHPWLLRFSDGRFVRVGEIRMYRAGAGRYRPIPQNRDAIPASSALNADLAQRHRVPP